MTKTDTMNAVFRIWVVGVITGMLASISIFALAPLWLIFFVITSAGFVTSLYLMTKLERSL